MYAQWGAPGSRRYKLAKICAAASLKVSNQAPKSEHFAIWLVWLVIQKRMQIFFRLLNKLGSVGRFENMW